MLGLIEGFSDCFIVGCGDPVMLSQPAGKLVGLRDFAWDGDRDGLRDGLRDGFFVGAWDGLEVGRMVGAREGFKVGVLDGTVRGLLVELCSFVGTHLSMG